ncbi:Uncharacterised protein (plasmid) [Tsukamurella tyrosinosolvens]|uniref:Uncharacterized protein n=1 Tax=Tsukamurella tyrosinosolvens TaxID=57704 RepID=A0A1H4U929_TSUTY|nr:hypothetical protein [Tsukamurella tyrosinosolvens]SEC64694.1 hypothetical protein SAMN04489793_2805 [Tsukamurella tyrosinosolvens]VEH94038.1 Uncharacterised protein [Tsukamurella tyrosinosolvens]
MIFHATHPDSPRELSFEADDPESALEIAAGEFAHELNLAVDDAHRQVIVSTAEGAAA